MFLWELGTGSRLAPARTVAVNTLVLFQVFYLFNARYILAPAYTRQGLLGNRCVLLSSALILLLQLAFTYLPPMQRLFGSAAIGAAEWMRIVLVAASVYVLVEVEKALLRRVAGQCV
jgi:magnesium-transporting ATPase (P-type)